MAQIMRIPTNDHARLRLLHVLLHSLQLTSETGNQAAEPPTYPLAELVPTNLAQDLESLVPSTETALADLERTTRAWRQAAMDAQIATTRLILCVRGVWTAMQRRLKDPTLSPEVASFYQVPPTRERNPRGGREGWLPLSRGVLRRLEEAEIAEVPTPEEPSMADLTACIAAADAGQARVRLTQTARKQAQAVMQQRRRQTVALYRRIVACVRSGLQALPPGQQRDVMRAMGIMFIGDEAPAPEPTPDTPDTPTEATDGSASPDPASNPIPAIG